MKNLSLTLKKNEVREAITIDAGAPFFSPLIAVQRFKPDTGRQSLPTIISTYSGVLTEDQAALYAYALDVAAKLCRVATNSSIENAYNLYKQNDLGVLS